ncbi:D-alanyl-D-alanine carboxypeptidase family protein [Prosthecobacter sp.]|uniref:D-alanyl-D-alanine carboxypeptidase family protein n=1 Tax=Prosthecobacter sp. TaxID=1965333 RepID=UPI0037837F65
MMTRLIQLLMTVTAACSLASCAEQGVTRAIPVAPNTQHMYSQGDSPQVMPVMLPERPMLVATSGPSIRAASYLLLDARTGQHLAGRAFETARGVASTQKIVTALVVLDAGNLDKMVRIQASDVAVEPTRLGIRPGEVYSRRELLYAFLVKSANDVANALARDNAGSIAAFTEKMNAKARSLGCSNSNFRNPHGLTVSGQYSTARDMARVAMAAYRNTTIRDVVRRKYFAFHRADGRVVTLTNTNELLGKMPECNGMKTGYTVASGRCLISSAASGSREVILVQLGTKTKYIWDDARIMMSWGLQRLRSSGGVAMSGW